MMTQDKETLREVLIEVIHEGLGGNGWAYSYYGNNELVHMRDVLGRAADAAIATMFERLRTPSEGMIKAMAEAFEWSEAGDYDDICAEGFSAALTAFQQENSDAIS